MKKRSSGVYVSVFVVVLLAIVSFIIFVLMSGKTTNFSEERGGDKVQYLSCLKHGVDEYILLEDSPDEDIDFKVKIKYLDDRLEELNMEISKEFQDEDEAESFVNNMHANYDIYLGKYGISGNGLTPSYSFIDGIGKVTIFVDGGSLNHSVAKLAFLDDGVLEDKSISNLSDYYERNDFSCIIK